MLKLKIGPTTQRKIGMEGTY